jgi:hypothetical protein
MDFEYIILKNGKFHSYGHVIVPSYEAYENYVDDLNIQAMRIDSDLSYKTA